jgi:hypothetical protein
MAKKDVEKAGFESAKKDEIKFVLAKKAKKDALKALAEKESTELDTWRQIVASKILETTEAGRLKVSVNVDSLFVGKLKDELEKLEYFVDVIERGEKSTLNISWDVSEDQK